MEGREDGGEEGLERKKCQKEKKGNPKKEDMVQCFFRIKRKKPTEDKKSFPLVMSIEASCPYTVFDFPPTL